MLAAALAQTPVMSSVRAACSRSALGRRSRRFPAGPPEERVEQIAVPEHQVLVELRAALAVEVDVEQLLLPQRLADGVHEVQAGHLLVADLRVHADHLVVLPAC